MKDRLKPSESFPSIKDFDRIEHLKVIDAKYADMYEASLRDDAPLGIVRRVYLGSFADYHRFTTDLLRSQDPETIPEFTLGALSWLRNSAFLNRPGVIRRLSQRIAFDDESGNIQPLLIQELLDQLTADQPRRQPENVLKDLDAILEAYAKKQV